MRSDKGLTLISVIVYVLVIAIVIGIISSINRFFYSNVMNVSEMSSNYTEYNKFATYILEESKIKGNKIQEVTKNSYILFSSGNKYIKQNNNLYKNNIKICSNVKEVAFDYYYKADKLILKVYIVIGEKEEYSKTSEYVMNL